MQLSPHMLVFDPQTLRATLEFRNPTDHVQCTQVQFAYLDYTVTFDNEQTDVPPDQRVPKSGMGSFSLRCTSS